MKTWLIGCASLLVGTSLSLAQATVSAASQREAVRKYPQLAVEGSPFHKEFIARVEKAKAIKDPVMNQPDWMLVIADQIGATIKRIRGRVTDIEKDALTVECGSPFGTAAPRTSHLGSIGGSNNTTAPAKKATAERPSEIEGTFWLTGHPKANSKANGDAVDVDAFESGVIKNDIGETLRKYGVLTVHE